MTSEPLLEVKDLEVKVGGVVALSGVSFEIRAGERVGLIGESGSGKSLTAFSIMGLLPQGLSATGQVTFDDRDLLTSSEKALCEIRGDDISMVFQEPMSALNPVMRIGDQVAESLRIHRSISKDEAARKAQVMLAKVALDAGRVRSYPHQLSGGQRQRVVIAIALVCGPSLLIADEPTTALDVTVQAQILALLSELVDEGGTSLFLITHDLAVVANTCERVLVMYGGRIVESGLTDEVFSDPSHPYTAGLLAAVPEIDLAGTRMQRLATIDGSVPGLGLFPSGCVFRNRCVSATVACENEPGVSQSGERSVSCWHPVTSGERRHDP